jgi:hypothetical protein
MQLGTTGACNAMQCTCTFSFPRYSTSAVTFWPCTVRDDVQKRSNLPETASQIVHRISKSMQVSYQHRIRAEQIRSALCPFFSSQVCSEGTVHARFTLHRYIVQSSIAHATQRCAHEHFSPHARTGVPISLWGSK